LADSGPSQRDAAPARNLQFSSVSAACSRSWTRCCPIQ